MKTCPTCKGTCDDPNAPADVHDDCDLCPTCEGTGEVPTTERTNR